MNIGRGGLYYRQKVGGTPRYSYSSDEQRTTQARYGASLPTGIATQLPIYPQFPKHGLPRIVKTLGVSAVVIGAFALWTSTFCVATVPPKAPSSVNSQPQKTTTSTAQPTLEQVKAQANLHYAQGIAYTKARDYKNAIHAYQQATTLKPDYAEAYHELAFALYKVGNFKESVACAQEAIKLNPNNADTYRNLGLAHQALGQSKEAIDALNQSLKLEPDDASTNYQLGVAFKNNRDIEGAIKAFTRAIQLKSDFASAHYELGLAYLAIEDLELATQQYNILITINPKLADKLLKKIPRTQEQDTYRP